MFAGNPILDEIKQGFKLRPTKTIDKSKPIIVAEIDDEDSIAPTKRTPAPPPPSLVVDTAPSEAPAAARSPRASPSPRSSPKAGPSSAKSSPSVPFPSGAPPPPPPPPGTGSMPPPPPPPPGAPAPPPPPPSNLPSATQKTRKSPSPFPQLGGKSPAEIDLGELLHSIQGGVRLRKTVTNDKSGLIVDETLKQQSVKLVEPAPSTAFIP
ncbi:WH2 domain-containing protein, partial [Trichostrongylus colubriformis]